MANTVRGLVIPQDSLSPVREIQIDNDGSGASGLSQLQGEVGGMVQSLPIPHFVTDADRATVYINEDGKYDASCKFNSRATDFMVPGTGIFFGDYIAGNMIVIGFDPTTGQEADIPEGVEKRVRLIESEAA